MLCTYCSIPQLHIVSQVVTVYCMLYVYGMYVYVYYVISL